MNIYNRFRNAWDIFIRPDRSVEVSLAEQDISSGYTTSYNPIRSRVHSSFGGDKSVVTSAINKIAMAVSYGFNIRHVRVDDLGKYRTPISSSLNDCLTFEANKDQTGRAFLMDVVTSLCEEGAVAIVPTIYDDDPYPNSRHGGGKSFKIYAMRTGKIQEWLPNSVRVELYNDATGQHQTMQFPKSHVGIIENPLLEIMNNPNGTMQRLMSKLQLLDIADSDSAGKKLDLIIQLPYVIKSESKRKQAEIRRKDIEEQLANSEFGIAYIDGTERITQMNRPVTNNLQEQVAYLTSQLYNQLGITEAVFTGKATEKELLHFYNTTVEPIVTSITDELNRKFITPTARTQGQRIMGFRDVLRLSTATEIAEMADSLSRNEIVAPNEFRQYLGFTPSSDPEADEIRNRNMPSTNGTNPIPESQNNFEEHDSLVKETLDIMEKDLMSIIEELV